jgi:hypothetical protein
VALPHTGPVPDAAGGTGRAVAGHDKAPVVAGRRGQVGQDALALGFDSSATVRARARAMAAACTPGAPVSR